MNRVYNLHKSGGLREYIGFFLCIRPANPGHSKLDLHEFLPYRCHNFQKKTGHHCQLIIPKNECFDSRKLFYHSHLISVIVQSGFITYRNLQFYTFIISNDHDMVLTWSSSKCSQVTLSAQALYGSYQEMNIPYMVI